MRRIAFRQIYRDFMAGEPVTVFGVIAIMVMLVGMAIYYSVARRRRRQQAIKEWLEDRPTNVGNVVAAGTPSRQEIPDAGMVSGAPVAKKMPFDCAWLPTDQLEEVLKHLGKPKQVFSPDGMQFFALLGAIGLVLAGFAFGGISIKFILEKKPADIWVGFVVGGILAISGCTWFPFARRYAYLRVLAYPDALVRVERDRFFPVLWDQVASVRQKITELHLHQGLTTVKGGVFYKFTIRMKDGQELCINKALGEGFEQFCAYLAERSREYLLPPAQAALKAGRKVYFGPFEMSQEGLHRNGDTLAWSKVELIDVLNGYVSVLVCGQAWTSVASHDVANLPVFLALARDYVPVCQ